MIVVIFVNQPFFYIFVELVLLDLEPACGGSMVVVAEFTIFCQQVEGVCIILKRSILPQTRCDFEFGFFPIYALIIFFG